MKDIFNRLREPSTWAGLAALGALFGVRPELVTAVGDATVALVTAGTAPNVGTVISAVTAVCSVVAVVVPEQKPPLLIVRGQG